MNNDLICLELKPSKLIIYSLALFTLTILSLIKFAEIFIWYKLLVLGASLLMICCIGYSQFLNSVKKLDFLLRLNCAVIWQQQFTTLASIERIYNIGFWAIIVKLRIKDKLKQIIIFPDSTDINNYKSLMRYSRWQN